MRKKSVVPGLGWRQLGLQVAALLSLLFLSGVLADCAAAASEADAPTVEPQEVSSYAADFGTSMSEARQAMQLQADEAGLPEEVEQALGGRGYAGIWFDNGAGEFVIPIAPGADASGLASDILAPTESYRVEEVSTPWAQLEAAQEKLSQRITGLASLPSQSASTYLDAETNSVVIRVSTDLPAPLERRLAALGSGLNVPARVEAAPAESLRVEDLSGCNEVQKACVAPLRGGTWWGFPNGLGQIFLHCTVGFPATGNLYGNRFMLTAGHCVEPETEYRAAWAEVPNPEKAESKEIGPLEEYKSTLNGARTEWAKYKANGSYFDFGTSTPEIAAWGEGEEYKILSEGSSYKGQEMCHSGATTAGRSPTSRPP